MVEEPYGDMHGIVLENHTQIPGCDVSLIHWFKEEAEIDDEKNKLYIW